MNRLMRRKVGTQPLGVWLALGSLAFMALVGGGGQVLSFLDWDAAVSAGFQEDRLDAPEVPVRVLAHVEWGVAAGDAFVAIPLLLAGIAGVTFRRHWGLLASLMGVSCWIYMVPIYALQRWSVATRAGLVPWERYVPLVAAFAILALVPSLLAVWGLVANAKRFSPALANSHRLRRTGECGPSRIEEWLRCGWQVLGAAFTVGLCGRRTWNVTAEERQARLACDELVDPVDSVDRAITIERPPESVWPWIAQFGRGAAYYSWDFLDNPGHRHADYLVDAPEPAIGDWCKVLGTVSRLDPGHELAWYDETPFLGARTRLAMAFRVTPVGQGATRLHFRMSCAMPKGMLGRFAIRVGLLMDRVMSVEALRRLKLLIETYEERVVSGETNRERAPHQRDEWRPAGLEYAGLPAS
jgi:hypothetical protein